MELDFQPMKSITDLRAHSTRWYSQEMKNDVYRTYGHYANVATYVRNTVRTSTVVRVHAPPSQVDARIPSLLNTPVPYIRKVERCVEYDAMTDDVDR